MQTGTKEARACATGLVAFDIIPETLAKTTLGSLRPGDRVNLEHSVTASTLMGGHFVQGHVDGVGVVTAVETDGQHRVTIKPSAELMACMIPQGSVAVDGVSLTLAALDTDTISVALIPTTLALTSLGALRAGARVNIEADMLVKAVVKTVRAIESQRR